jgi:hypothetical protein
VFNGQPKQDGISYRRDVGKAPVLPAETQMTLFPSVWEDLLDDTGYRNAAIELDNAQLLKNICEMQSENYIKLSPSLIKELGTVSLDLEQMLEISIMHWSVETIHNILDDTETIAEDKCRVYRGSGAEFLSMMRKLGINLLLPFNRIYDSESFREIINMCRRCLPLLEAILTKNPEEVGSIKEWQ